jgi:hypothetical protein
VIFGMIVMFQEKPKSLDLEIVPAYAAKGR